jgi:hypothetical protein
MMAVCENCQTAPAIKRFFEQAEQVVTVVNGRVQAAQGVMGGLRSAGLLTATALDEPIEYTYFDYWHYYGRTAKHGAFMGGADFVQWHGNYELVKGMVELQAQARELRAAGHVVGAVGPLGGAAAQPGAGAGAAAPAGAGTTRGRTP